MFAMDVFSRGAACIIDPQKVFWTSGGSQLQGSVEEDQVMNSGFCSRLIARTAPRIKSINSNKKYLQIKNLVWNGSCTRNSFPGQRHDHLKLSEVSRVFLFAELQPATDDCQGER